MKFSEAIDKFLAYKQAEVKESTMNYYAGKIPMLRKYLGNYDVDAIDKFVIAEFTNKQKERNPNITNRTLNYYRTAITHIIEIVTDRKLKVNKLRVDKKEVPAIPDRIIDLILSHLYENRNKRLYPHYYKYYFMLKLMLDTGARINEIVNIKIKYVDLFDCSIFLDVTKYDKQRYVFFKKDLVPIFQKYLHRYNVESGYLFPGGTDSEKHLTKYAVMKFLNNLRNRLGIERSISSHKFRHTMAAHFMENGGGIYSLSQLLGHEEITTTQIYAKMSRAKLQEIYNETMDDDVK